jgi:glycine betaine/choline ABC-type transport system substrate-binding protein
MAARRLTVALIASFLVAGCGGTTPSQSVAVGARDDVESTLLANLYAAALRTYGTDAHVEVVPDPLTGLDSGDVRVAPGFTGRLLNTFAPDARARAAVQVYRDMVSALPEGVAAGDYAESAEDKPALAVTEGTVDAWGGRDVTAAVRNCDKLKIGRVVGVRNPGAIGTCVAAVRDYRDAARLFDALRIGQVTAAWTSTADPDIPADALVLADRTALIRAENVVPLYRRNELTEMQELALNEVAGVLDTAGLVQMRRQVAAGTDPAHVADGYLAEHPLGAASR